MIQLEDLQPTAAVRGILPDSLVTVVSVQWHGSVALELTYKTPAGKVANELLYRSDEDRLAIVAEGRPWSFDGDGSLFRLVSEAHRIRLAHLFDPVLAVHTSLVDPLPHQITAVYEAMLPRQPLRLLLADDPGAGKTIRFEGRFRDGVHKVDVSDLMRRMVKERLFKFDCKPLFPERIAHTVCYRLSEPETRLYKEVTEYVREEFNRAEALLDDKRRGTVGFALPVPVPR